MKSQACILVVDDKPENIDVLSNILQDTYNVLAATSGEKALEIARRQNKPDLILLDVKMPGIDGYATCHKLKSNEDTLHIPIIFVTAENDVESEERGLTLGAVDYITKPFNPALIMVRIANQLDLKRHRDNLEIVVKERTKELHNEHKKSLKSERLYRGLMEAAPDSIILVNKQGGIELVNKTVTKMFGYGLEELQGHPIEILIPNRFVKQHVALRNRYNKKAHGRESFSIDNLVGLRKDGSEFPVDISLSPMDADKGSMVICIIRNMTEQKKIAEQLRQAHKMEALGQLTAGIAHDFNNMLGCILGFTELSLELKENERGGKLDGFLKSVYQAGERARDLIAQMMAFSRGSADTELQSLYLPPVIKEVIQMLRPVLPSSIDIESNINSDVPEVMVDPVQINQIVMNLCVNARDAMQENGLIKLSLERSMLTGHVCTSCHEQIEGDYVEINVNDNGTGIDGETLNNMFDPFFTTKEVGKGTGMGLSVVHGILHDYSGHIIVNSILGEGTTFRLLIPVMEINKTKTKTVDRNAVNEVIGNGQQILIVDDDESVGYFLEQLLLSKGFQVTNFKNSESALNYFSEHKDNIDLVITDQTMPKITGVELAQAMLKLRQDLPVILCSGYSSLVNKENFKTFGIGAYFSKPIRIQEFLQTIDGFLNK